MKKILPITILLAAIGGGYWWWRDAHATDPNRILVSGNLELTLVDLSFKIAGRMTELKKLVEVLGISRQRLYDKVSEFQTKYEFNRVGQPKPNGGSGGTRYAGGPGDERILRSVLFDEKRRNPICNRRNGLSGYAPGKPIARAES